MVYVIKNPVGNRILALVILLFTLSAFMGCQRYGSVSDKSYDYASALYTACNLKSEQRIESLQSAIESDSELPDQEKEWLLAVVSMAQSGDWEQALVKTRNLMEEQISKVP